MIPLFVLSQSSSEVDPSSGDFSVVAWSSLSVTDGSWSSVSSGSTSSSSRSILSAHSPPDWCEPGLKRVLKSSEKPGKGGGRGLGRCVSDNLESTDHTVGYD